MRKATDIEGKRYGRLVALRNPHLKRMVFSHINSYGGEHWSYKCRCGDWNCKVMAGKWPFHCDCGWEGLLSRFDVIRGKTKSCGCLKKEKVLKNLGLVKN